MPGEQKKRKQKREMSEEKRAQCKNSKLKKDDNAIRVANCQNNYDRYVLFFRSFFNSHSFSSSTMTPSGFFSCGC